MRIIERPNNIRIPSICAFCGCTLNKVRTGNIIDWVHPINTLCDKREKLG